MNIDNLLQNKPEEFRNEIHASLYNIVKDKLHDKRIEVASSMFLDQNNDKPCDDCEKEKSNFN